MTQVKKTLARMTREEAIPFLKDKKDRMMQAAALHPTGKVLRHERAYSRYVQAKRKLYGDAFADEILRRNIRTTQDVRRKRVADILGKHWSWNKIKRNCPRLWKQVFPQDKNPEAIPAEKLGEFGNLAGFLRKYWKNAELQDLRINDYNVFQTYFGLADDSEEMRIFRDYGKQHVFSVNMEILSQMDPDHPATDPVARLFSVFSPGRSKNTFEGEIVDPSGESLGSSVAQWMTWRYDTTIKINYNPSSGCIVICKGCQRIYMMISKENLRGTANPTTADTREESKGRVHLEDIPKIIETLKEFGPFANILITGGDAFGDPMKENFEVLIALIKALMSIEGFEGVIRLASIVPVTNPWKAMLAAKALGKLPKRIRKRLYVVTQCNHTRLITADFERVVDLFLSKGIKTYNQSVLWQDVNTDLDEGYDLPGEYAARCLGTGRIGVQEYYAFLPKIMEGSTEDSPGLLRAIEIETLTRNHLPGHCLPLIIISALVGGEDDTPNGKIPLAYVMGYIETPQGAMALLRIPGEPDALTKYPLYRPGLPVNNSNPHHPLIPLLAA